MVSKKAVFIADDGRSEKLFYRKVIPHPSGNGNYLLTWFDKKRDMGVHKGMLNLVKKIVYNLQIEKDIYIDDSSLSYIKFFE